MKIKIAIAGYGNLGKGVENAVLHTPDMELVAVFTRRDPAGVKTRTGVAVYGMDAIESDENGIVRFDIKENKKLILKVLAKGYSKIKGKIAFLLCYDYHIFFIKFSS